MGFKKKKKSSKFSLWMFELGEGKESGQLGVGGSERIKNSRG